MVCLVISPSCLLLVLSPAAAQGLKSRKKAPESSLAAGSLVSQGCRQREQVAAMDPEGQARRQREQELRLVEQELRLVAQALGNQLGTSQEDRARITRAFNMARRQLWDRTHSRMVVFNLE